MWVRLQRDACIALGVPELPLPPGSGSAVALARAVRACSSPCLTCRLQQQALWQLGAPLRLPSLHQDLADPCAVPDGMWGADGFGDTGLPPDVGPGAVLEGEITLVSWKAVQVCLFLSGRPCLVVCWPGAVPAHVPCMPGAAKATISAAARAAKPARGLARQERQQRLCTARRNRWLAARSMLQQPQIHPSWCCRPHSTSLQPQT